MSPKGKPLTQDMVKQLAQEEEIAIVCGRFEGIDERVIEAYNIEEVSIGDYVLTGGEQAAQILLDAVVRLLPGVLGNSESTLSESFEDNLLEYPQYTKPRTFRGQEVPEVLLGGNHEKIRRWRLKESLRKTAETRPDLIASRQLSKEEKQLLEEIEEE